VPLVAGRVRLDVGVIEHLGEVDDALGDGLARVARLRELPDHRGDVLRADLVHAARAEDRQHAVERHPVQDAGGLGDVDAGGLPAHRRLPERGGTRGSLGPAQRPEVGDAQGSHLAGDPVAANLGLTHRREGAAVARARPGAAEPEPNAVAHRALVLALRVGRALVDPGARHQRASRSRSSSSRRRSLMRPCSKSCQTTSRRSRVGGGSGSQPAEAEGFVLMIQPAAPACVRK
jgi:hypothetical protein